MLVVGQILQERYRIVQQLGEGGMGVIYQGVDMRLNSHVAIKETMTTEDEFVRAFRREAQLLANLHHPALPRVIDHFSEGLGQYQGHYLVMDFIEGEDLKALAARYPNGFPVENVFDWTKQLLDVLEYLHNQPTPILHRDIKPANIKVKNGRIVLLDFGLARGQAGQMTISNLKTEFQGYTPNFAPPEQVQGQGTTEQSDIYSFSSTVYQLLSGVLPSDAVERMLAVATGKPDTLIDIRRIKPDLNENFAFGLMSGLALDSDKRPPSVAVMRQALFSGDPRKTAERQMGVNTAERTMVLNTANQIAENTQFNQPPNFAHHQTVPLNNLPTNPQNNLPATQFFSAPPPKSQVSDLPPNIQEFKPNDPKADFGDWNKISQPTVTHRSGSKLPVILAGVFGLFFLVAVAGIAIWSMIPSGGGGQNGPGISLFPSANKREKAVELTQKAESFIQAGKYDESIQASKQSIETDPDYAPAYAFYGDAKWDSEYNNVLNVADMPEVQKSADKILELIKEPKTAEDYMSLSWAKFAKDKPEDAVSDATKAIELKSNYTAAYMIRASALKDTKKAVDDFTETLRLNPNYPQAYRNRSACYTKLKQHTKAISDLTEAIRLLPSARMYAARGDVYLDQKKFDYAKKEYEEALRLDPKSASAYLGIADVFYLQSKWKEALPQYQKVLEINPTLGGVANTIGHCYFAQKDWENAVRSYSEAIRLLPNDPIVYENRAGAYRQLGKTDLAKTDEETAKRLKQQNKSNPKQNAA